MGFKLDRIILRFLSHFDLPAMDKDSRSVAPFLLVALAACILVQDLFFLK